MTFEYDYVECRAMGHSWRHKGTIGNTHPKYHAPFNWASVGKLSNCLECKGWRVRWITPSGEVINRYYPPDGYSLKGQKERPSLREFRSFYVAEVFAEFTHIEWTSP
jgi:hypothetical protein